MNIFYESNQMHNIKIQLELFFLIGEQVFSCFDLDGRLIDYVDSVNYLGIVLSNSG